MCDEIYNSNFEGCCNVISLDVLKNLILRKFKILFFPFETGSRDKILVDKLFLPATFGPVKKYKL